MLLDSVQYPVWAIPKPRSRVSYTSTGLETWANGEVTDCFVDINLPYSKRLNLAQEITNPHDGLVLPALLAGAPMDLLNLLKIADCILKPENQPFQFQLGIIQKLDSFEATLISSSPGWVVADSPEYGRVEAKILAPQSPSAPRQLTVFHQRGRYYC